MLLSSPTGNYSDYNNKSSEFVNLYDLGVISLQQVTTFNQLKALAIGLCVPGILTSILNVLANSRCGGHDAFVSYFTAVSVADNLYLTSACTGLIINLFFPFSSRVFEVYSLYVCTFASTVFRSSTIVLNDIACTERFIKLIFPLRLFKLVLSSYPRWIIIGVFLLSFLMHLSLVVEFEVRQVRVNVWAMVPSRLQEENVDLFLVLRNAGRMTFFYLPMMYLLIINVALVAALHRHAGNQRNIRATKGLTRKDNQANKKHEPDQELRRQASDRRNIQTEAVMRTSRLVLVLTFTFFLLALPRVANSTVASFAADYGYETKNRYLTDILSYMAECLAYLTQPFLFTVNIIYSQQFKKSLVQKLHLDCLFRHISGNNMELNTVIKRSK